MNESKGIALYHIIKSNENFNTAVNHIFQLIRTAQEKHPNKPRLVYIDIEGHKNSKGGFDTDMLEFQTEFACGFLMQYITELSIPLVEGKLRNNKGQINDIPDVIQIVDKDALDEIASTKE